VVLAISDITDLDFTGRGGISGLGRLGDGRGQGLQQHTTLGLDPDAGVIGVLRQKWYLRPEAPKGETRGQKRGRWRESDVWGEAAREIGTLGPGCRVIQVADRGADIFGYMHACREVGAGFVVRAVHDRSVLQTSERLWTHVARGPVLDQMEVKVSKQRGASGGKSARRVARTAQVTLRAACVRIPPPPHDPKMAGAEPITLHAVYVKEENPPTGEDVTPVEWMILTSELVVTKEDARRVAGWYARRWVVEEFHRVEKEGCKLQSSQLDDAADIQRLAAITAVVAVRLLQLRDAADSDNPRADDPAMLAELAGEPFLRVIAALAKTKVALLTPRLVLETVARRGGWLARKNDPRPGWKVLWSGWHDIALMTDGLMLMSNAGP
jgi:Transposase Tn5 dimerisation domain/Transposase DDE domain